MHHKTYCLNNTLFKKPLISIFNTFIICDKLINQTLALVNSVTRELTISYKSHMKKAQKKISSTFISPNKFEQLKEAIIHPEYYPKSFFEQKVRLRFITINAFLNIRYKIKKKKLNLTKEIHYALH